MVIDYWSLFMQACKHYQDKNCMLIFSNKISRMVESVLGGQLEVTTLVAPA